MGSKAVDYYWFTESLEGGDGDYVFECEPEPTQRELEEIEREEMEDLDIYAVYSERYAKRWLKGSRQCPENKKYWQLMAQAYWCLDFNLG